MSITKRYQIFADRSFDQQILFSLQGPGDVVHARTFKDSTWKWDKNDPRLCGAGGNGVPPSAGYPAGSPEGSLVFRRTEIRPWGPVLLQIGYWTADDQTQVFNYDGRGSGIYAFQINDNILGDNDGYIWLEVTYDREDLHRN